MRKRVSVMIVVGLLGATLLTGCVVVPFNGWGYGGGGHYRYQPSPYRPYYQPDR
jgi:hypothetical protein